MVSFDPMPIVQNIQRFYSRIDLKRKEKDLIRNVS